MQKMTKIFLLNSLLCWKRMYGIPGFSKMKWPPILRKQQRLSCRICSVIALLGMVFGHHNSQTSCHLIYFSRDFFKKEFSAVTQEACRTLFIKWNINQPTRRDVREHCEKGKCLSSRRWIFLAPFVIIHLNMFVTLFITFLISFKKYE